MATTATASGAGERWVGLAMDFSEGSRAALRWAVDNLLRAGDQLLLLHVIKEPDYEQSEAILWEATGSPLIPLSDFSEPTIAKKYGVKPDAETLDILNTVAKQKEVMVVAKVLWGDPREKLCQAISEIPMSCLVIGSRGLGKLKRLQPIRSKNMFMEAQHLTHHCLILTVLVRARTTSLSSCSCVSPVVQDLRMEFALLMGRLAVFLWLHLNVLRGVVLTDQLEQWK